MGMVEYVGAQFEFVFENFTPAKLMIHPLGARDFSFTKREQKSLKIQCAGKVEGRSRGPQGTKI